MQNLTQSMKATATVTGFHVDELEKSIYVDEVPQTHPGDELYIVPRWPARTTLWTRLRAWLLRH